MTEVSYILQDRIAFIRLAAASQGNAFTPAMRRELNEALVRYRDDEEAWMAVVHGDGKDFCTGTADAQPAAFAEARERSLLWAGGYVETWKPLIAAIQGQCRGEGFSLALGCDLRVAEETAYFEADFDTRQGAPNVMPAWLVNQVGLSSTFELLWLRKTLDARRAHQIGLVNRLVVRGEAKAEADTLEGRLPMVPMEPIIVTPHGDALTGGTKLAQELLLYGPVTRRFQKETAYRSVGVPFHYAQTLEVGPNPYASEDRIEGTRAFVENRRPVWRNR